MDNLKSDPTPTAPDANHNVPDNVLDGVLRRREGNGDHDSEKSHVCSGFGPAESREDVAADDKTAYAENITQERAFPVVERDVSRSASLPRDFRFREFRRRTKVVDNSSATVVRQTERAGPAIKLMIEVIVGVIIRKFGIPEDVANEFAISTTFWLLKRLID